MLRRILAMGAIAALLIGLGCSGGTGPVVPNKGIESTPEEFFNGFVINREVVGEFVYMDFDGNVLASGTLGRNDEGVYIIESRGGQTDWDATPLALLLAMVTYNNPQGTLETGPNAGLPYYYVDQTVDYNINVLSLLWEDIGALGENPYGWSGPAELTTEMRYAMIDANGYIVAGDLMPGDPIFTWTGIISPGYMVLNDTYYIPPETLPGLNITTVRITAPVFFGMVDIVFFDCIAGIWDTESE